LKLVYGLLRLTHQGATVATSARHRVALSLALASFLLCQSLFAIQTPLSETAVREAYFLGQRHDQSVSDFFAKYAKALPAPRFGPDIAVIRLLTPYAQVVSLSANHTGNYSAQQAEREHNPDSETVLILVDIYFTDSYGPFLIVPNSSRSGTAADLTPRPSDFWHDFDVSVTSEAHTIHPKNTSGQPIYSCSEGGCTLVGATITLTFVASKFPSDSVTVNVAPPEGDDVNVDFDLTSFR
jgi:hypothetical protein